MPSPNATPDAQRSTGTLIIASPTPSDATLYIDGRAVGPLPQQVELPPGQHEVTAIGARVEARPIRVLVEPGKTMSLGLNLVPKPGLFEIDPVAPDAVLVVDQQSLGSGKRTVSLPPGRHVLELRRVGYQTQRLSLEVQPGQQQHLAAAAYARDKSAVAAAPPATPPVTPPIAQQANAPLAAEAPAKTPPLAEQPEPSSPYTGIFGSFVVPVMLGGKSTHSYVDACPAKAYGGACTTSAPRGGGLGLRLGYFYEWIGLEVMGAGAVDVSTTELKLPPIPTISSSMQDLAGRSVFVRAGGMFGVGLRLAVPMQGLRFTVGADYLYIYRKVIAIPDSFAGANLSYTVPGWFIDGGIQLGSTPGARFYIGAFVMIEQAHDLPLTRNLSALGVDTSFIPAELTQMKVYQGRQVFYGPLLGIAFGH
ncbi:MAG TPA: PEGA domain-containing protein [Polyangiaceae bacterium]